MAVLTLRFQTYKIANMNDTNNSKLRDDSTPVSPLIYCSIYTIMTILFILALLENISVLIVYKNNSKIHNKTNMWILAIFLCDSLLIVNAFPYVIVNSFAKRNIFGEYGCKYDGFIVTLLGTSSIYLLTGLSAQRYHIMIHTTSAQSCSNTKLLISIAMCFVFGFFWGVVPLIGWGSYSLEGIGISCAPNWRSEYTRDRTYMIAMYVFVLFIQVVVIGYCYFRILFKIWREKRNRGTWLQQRRVKRDIKVTISVAFTILSFIVSWLPYAVVSLLEGFFQIDIQSVSPMLVVLPCLMAKTACIWNPIVYVCHNSRYRNAYIKTFGFFRRFTKQNSDHSDTSENNENQDDARLNSKRRASTRH